MEKSAGAIIFRKEKGEVYFLLLKYSSQAKKAKDYWGFPKGHVEKGETEKQTVLREVKEETGIRDLKFRKGFREKIDYRFKKEGRLVFKIVVFYLAQTATKKVDVSFEHIGYQWVRYNDAFKALSYKNDKDLLKSVESFLK